MSLEKQTLMFFQNKVKEYERTLDEYQEKLGYSSNPRTRKAYDDWIDRKEMLERMIDLMKREIYIEERKNDRWQQF